MQSTLNAPIYKPKIITLPPSFKDHLSKSFHHRPLTPEHPPSPHLSTSSFITTTHNQHNSSFNTIKTYKIDLSKRTIKPIHSLSHNNSTITTSSNTISKYSSSNPNISAFVYSNQNKIQNLKHHKKSIQLNKLIQTTSQPTLQSKKKYPKFSLKNKLSKPSSNSKLNTTLYNKDIALLKQMTIKRKDDDNKHYTYRSTQLNCTFDKKQQSVSFTQRQNNWKKKVDKKKKELSDISRNKESCSCTFKPKINKGVCKNNNSNNDNECGKKYVNNIEGYTVKRKEVLNGIDKDVKKKNKRNGSYQGKKSNKEEGYVNDVKDTLKVKQYVEKEENSFWDEDCLS